MFIVTIKTSNATFDPEDLSYEVSRILKELADDISDYNLQGRRGGLLRDYNGNTVGGWSYQP